MADPRVIPETATVFVDPRPPLKVEKEKAHDFEVHRESGYAKGHTRPSKEVTAAPIDQVAVGAQPHVAPAVVNGNAHVVAPVALAVNAVDPRPPLKVEKEKVHDYEAHREGGYVKGHTALGANAAGAGLMNVPGGPGGHALPGHATT